MCDNQETGIPLVFQQRFQDAGWHSILDCAQCSHIVTIVPNMYVLYNMK